MRDLQRGGTVSRASFQKGETGVEPVSPVIEGFETSERVLCGDGSCPHEPKHTSLAVHFDEERERIAAGHDLYIWQELHGHGFPPILPLVETPEAARG